MSKALRNHIHLDTSLELTGEKAPPTKWYTAARSQTPTVIGTLSRSRTGKIHIYSLGTPGSPTVLRDYEYILRIEGDETTSSDAILETLFAMYFKELYLVDHYHEADGVDHSPSVCPVIFSNIGKPKALNPIGTIYLVEIQLKDNSL